MDDGHGAQAEHQPTSCELIEELPGGHWILDFIVGNFLEFHQMVHLVDGVLIWCIPYNQKKILLCKS